MDTCDIHVYTKVKVSYEYYLNFIKLILIIVISEVDKGADFGFNQPSGVPLKMVGINNLSPFICCRYV